VSANIC